MKTLSLITSLLFILPLTSVGAINAGTSQFVDHAPDHVVSVTDAGDEFILKVVTANQQPSICALSMRDLEIVEPTEQVPGEIAFHVYVAPETICLMAFGLRTGIFVFEKGDPWDTTPEEESQRVMISLGKYYLTVSGTPYGLLIVTDDDTYLQRIDED